MQKLVFYVWSQYKRKIAVYVSYFDLVMASYQFVYAMYIEFVQ